MRATWHLPQFYPLLGTLPGMQSKAGKVVKALHLLRAMSSVKIHREKPERRKDCGCYFRERACWERTFSATNIDRALRVESPRISNLQEQFPATGGLYSQEGSLPTNTSLLCLPCGDFPLVHCLLPGDPSVSHSRSFSIAKLGSSEFTRIQIWVLFVFTLTPQVTSSHVQISPTHC